MAEPSRQAHNDNIRADGARFLIVEARFYDAIGTMLLDGARAVLESAGARVDVVTMPGALEIPIAASIAIDNAAESGTPYQGVIALGCIIRGETYHFEIVSNESARALMALAVARNMPLGNAILTVEDEIQAIVRADRTQGDKGGEAARAALALFELKQQAGLF